MKTFSAYVVLGVKRVQRCREHIKSAIRTWRHLKTFQTATIVALSTRVSCRGRARGASGYSSIQRRQATPCHRQRFDACSICCPHTDGAKGETEVRLPTARTKHFFFTEVNAVTAGPLWCFALHAGLQRPRAPARPERPRRTRRRPRTVARDASCDAVAKTARATFQRATRSPETR